MKSFIIILIIGVCFLFSFYTAKADSRIIIPDEAIIMRIIANSDLPYDQEIKIQVRNKIQEELKTLLNENMTVEQVRIKMQENLMTFETIVNDIFLHNNYQKDFSVKYGLNYFPEKEYEGISYDEGEYESLLITLGEGKGKNWWCVLFPPLCMLEAEESTEVEYKFFVQEIIDKYLFHK